MATDVERLVVSLEANMRQFERKMDRANQKADNTSRRMERRFQRAGRHIERSFSMMSRGAVTALGAIGVAVGGAQLAQLVRDSLAAAEAIGDMSERAGVSAEFLQEMRFAASQNGAEIRDWDDAISRLNRRLGLFQQYLATGTGEAGPAANALRALGLETRVASGELGDAEAVFLAAVEAMQDIEDQSRRSALASQLFGEDSGPRLAQLLALGTAGIEEQRRAARELGIVMDEDLRAQAAAASDAFERMGMQFSARMNNAIATQADNLVSLAEALASVAEWAINAAAALGQMHDRAQRTNGGVDAMMPISDDERATMLSRARNLRDRIAGRETGRRLGPSDYAALRYELGSNAWDREGQPLGVNSELTPELTHRLLSLINLRIEQLEGFEIPEPPGNGSSNNGNADGARGRSGSGSPAIIPPAGGVVFGPSPRNPIDVFREGLARDAELWQEVEEKLKGAATAVAEQVKEDRGEFADTFGRGMADAGMALADGRFPEYFARRLRGALYSNLFDLFTRLGEMLFDRMSGGKGGRFEQLASVAFGGGRASGGPVLAGRAYRVGERGPETLVMGQAGHVLANAAQQRLTPASAMNLSVNQQVNVSADGAVSAAEVRSIVDQASAASSRALKENLRRELPGLMRRSQLLNDGRSL